MPKSAVIFNSIDFHEIRDLANWYFSRSALPYWSILLLNCMFVVFAVALAFTVHHGSEQTLSVLGSLACPCAPSSSAPPSPSGSSTRTLG